ncbi:MAG: ABC transporter ATP-binding protein [Deltaproteobacteria bacterium]|nr:ABC transporter ATP-binding protein [Deltaproteobacteria bacterium]
MIELRGIRRTFVVGDQEVRALRDVDLSIGYGEYVSIMGPSGSGKSTLLNVLGLLDRPDAGSYRLEGHDVTALGDAEQARVRRERIGFVFQFFHLVSYLTAKENVELPLVLAGVPPAERRDRVAASLRDMSLANRAHHRPDQLSGGQRQRVAIARATVTRPAMLLADEPTGNLDRSSGSDVIAILEQLRDAGLTLIVVTHDGEVGERAQRRVRMTDGNVVGDESAA